LSFLPIIFRLFSLPDPLPSDHLFPHIISLVTPLPEAVAFSLSPFFLASGIGLFFRFPPTSRPPFVVSIPSPFRCPPSDPCALSLTDVSPRVRSLPFPETPRLKMQPFYLPLFSFWGALLLEGHHPAPLGVLKLAFVLRTSPVIPAHPLFFSVSPTCSFLGVFFLPFFFWSSCLGPKKGSFFPRLVARFLFLFVRFISSILTLPQTSRALLFHYFSTTNIPD